MSAVLNWMRRHQVLMVAALLIVAVGLILLVAGRKGADPRLEKIRLRGYPVTLRDLSAWYADVPEERNAALTCLRAFDILDAAGSSNSVSELLKGDFLPDPGRRLASERERELQNALDSIKPAIDILLSLPVRPEARYPANLALSFNALLPHLRGFKPSLMALGGRAILQARRGDFPAVRESLQAGANVIATLTNEPTLISQLLRTSCHNILVRHIEAVVNERPLTVEQLQALEAILEDSRTEGALTKGLVGERVFGLAAFDNREARSMFLGGGAGTGQTNSNVRITAAVALYKGVGIFGRDRSYYLDMMDKYVGTSELPHPQQWQVAKSLGTNPPPGRTLIVSRMLLPALANAIKRESEAYARTQIAKTGLAVERFRRSHNGAVPATLQELVPHELAALPADPFDGQPLRYRKLDSGFVVYSIGSDGLDQGGVPPERKKKGSAQPAPDVSFTIRTTAVEGTADR